MPFILYSYITAEILAPFFASLLILNGVLFAGRLMQVFDVIFTLHIGFADFLRLCAYITPNLLLFAVPMATTMGVIIAFTRMNNDNEMIAFKASGIGIIKMLPPIIIFATATALLTGYCATRLIPAGSIAMKDLMLKLAKEKIDKGIQEKRFSEGTGDIVFYVDHIDPETQEWQGVYLSDLRDKENPVLTTAKSGRFTTDLENLYLSLYLKNGTLLRSKEDVSQTIDFSAYTINIPFQSPNTTGDEPAYHENKNRLYQADLAAKVEEFGPKSYMGNYYLVEYHERLALPVGCFILALLGVPLALMNRTGRRHIGIPLGLGFFLLYYVIVTAAKGLCDDTELPVGLVMWLPNIIFFMLTLFVYRISAQEKWDAVFSRFSLTRRLAQPQ